MVLPSIVFSRLFEQSLLFLVVPAHPCIAIDASVPHDAAPAGLVPAETAIFRFI